MRTTQVLIGSERFPVLGAHLGSGGSRLSERGLNAVPATALFVATLFAPAAAQISVPGVGPDRWTASPISWNGVVDGGQLQGPIAAARMRLAVRKAQHFRPEAREERVGRALKALTEVGVALRLTHEEWKWVTQESDVEDV
jgi:hypothetical protein